MMQSCANSRAAKVDANAYTTPATPSIADEASASRLPPMRSVHTPPTRLNASCATTGADTSVPIATPE